MEIRARHGAHWQLLGQCMRALMLHFNDCCVVLRLQIMCKMLILKMSAF